MIKIAFCNNDFKLVSQLEEVILDTCKQNNIPAETDVFYSGAALEQEVIQGTGYDLIYLDIQNEDGITTVANIRKIDTNVLIIFISGYDSNLMSLFRLDVFALIKKPIIKEEFATLFLEANEKICSKDFYFIYSYRSKEYRIPCSKIVYFESCARQIRVHMQDSNTEIFNGKLNDVEERLKIGKIPFLRIHQSYLINYKLIKARSKSLVTMIDETTLPISEDRQKVFDWRYTKLLREEQNNGICY